jgi:hypothetical protein
VGHTYYFLEVERSIYLKGEAVFNVLVSVVIDLGAGDGVGVNDKFSSFTLSDMRASLLDMSEGHPAGHR